MIPLAAMLPQPDGTRELRQQRQCMMVDLDMAGAGYGPQTQDAAAYDWALAPDEVLLWQGRPDATPAFTRLHLFTLLRGGFALALFVYILGRVNMGLSPYRDIQVIVFVLFFMSLPIDIAKHAFTRRISRYALTSQRAIIATAMPLFGTRTLHVPILPDTRIDVLKHRRTTTLLFAQPRRAWWDLRAAAAPVGFERIADGAAVLALMRGVQRRLPA